MTTATAKLTGRITITPPLSQDELDRVPCFSYVRTAISAGSDDGMGYVEQQGDAIIPGPVAPLSTGAVARDIKDLIVLFPGHRFEGLLVREAAAKFGGAKSSITVLDDGRTVRF